MHLEIRHLRLVAAIADAGGVTRAAERLHLTQSALSHQLRDLEAKLGTALYSRVGRRLVPTAAGERVLAVARRVLADVSRVEAEVVGGGTDSDPVGFLRLATECYTCYHWLPPVLSRFRTAWPRVELRIVGEATRRPLPALARGDLDVAIVSRSLGGRSTVAPPRARRLQYMPLFEDELVAIMAPGHPLEERTRVRGYAEAADFVGEHLVLYNMNDEESTILHEVLRPVGVSPASVTRVELTEAIVELVKAGLGVGVLAKWAVAPQTAAGDLVALRLGATGYRRRWSAVTHDHDTLSPHVAGFLAMLEADRFWTALESPGQKPVVR